MEQEKSRQTKVINRFMLLCGILAILLAICGWLIFDLNNENEKLLKDLQEATIIVTIEDCPEKFPPRHLHFSLKRKTIPVSVVAKIKKRATAKKIDWIAAETRKRLGEEYINPASELVYLYELGKFMPGKSAKLANGYVAHWVHYGDSFSQIVADVYSWVDYGTLYFMAREQRIENPNRIYPDEIFIFKSTVSL